MRRHLDPLRRIQSLERYSMITFGIFLMVGGFYYFLVPVDLVIGGMSGVGLVVSRYVDTSIALWVLLLNALLLILAFFFLGKKAFYRSLYGSILYPLFLFLLEFTPTLNLDDFFIASIFGGAFVGIGFGIVVRYGGTSGGSDIPVKLVNKYFKIPLSVSVYVVDGVIIIAGILTASSGETLYGLYSLISVYILGRAADRMVLGSNSLKTVHTITDFPDAIKAEVYLQLNRGVTVVPVKGGYTAYEKTMLITVITKAEYYPLRNLVAKIDPNAFVYASPATEIHGDFAMREEE